MKKNELHTVALFDAKTHLSKLLEKVQSGNVITITKRGIPVAQLIPYKEQSNNEEISGLLKDVESIRKNIKSKVNIRQSIREGRRY